MPACSKSSLHVAISVLLLLLCPRGCQGRGLSDPWCPKSGGDHRVRRLFPGMVQGTPKSWAFYFPKCGLQLRLRLGLLPVDSMTSAHLATTAVIGGSRERHNPHTLTQNTSSAALARRDLGLHGKVRSRSDGALLRLQSLEDHLVISGHSRVPPYLINWVV